MSTPQDGSRATQAISDAVDGVRLVGVQRNRRARQPSGWQSKAELVSDLPLEMYVGYILSVGGTRQEATAEWDAAQRVRSETGPG